MSVWQKVTRRGNGGERTQRSRAVFKSIVLPPGEQTRARTSPYKKSGRRITRTRTSTKTGRRTKCKQLDSRVKCVCVCGGGTPTSSARRCSLEKENKTPTTTNTAGYLRAEPQAPPRPPYYYKYDGRTTTRLGRKKRTRKDARTSPLLNPARARAHSPAFTVYTQVCGCVR